MSFNEDKAVEIASASPKAEEFQKKYPKSVWTVSDISLEDTKQWIADHPKADVGADPPSHLWVADLAALGVEKLTLIVSPSTQKVIASRTEKLEADEEDVDIEDEDELCPHCGKSLRQDDTD